MSSPASSCFLSRFPPWKYAVGREIPVARTLRDILLAVSVPAIPFAAVVVAGQGPGTIPRLLQPAGRFGDHRDPGWSIVVPVANHLLGITRLLEAPPEEIR